MNKTTMELYLENPNICKCCGQPILPKDITDTRKLHDIKRKKFCSMSCAAKVNNIGKRKKNPEYCINNVCINCGKPTGRAENKYCSHKCQNDYQYKEFIKKWKYGEETGLQGQYKISLHIRKYLFQLNNNKCCKCGWDKINPVTKLSPLEIHHVDGDCTNNKEENLELLCPNCHSLTENFGSLNRGNSKRK